MPLDSDPIYCAEQIEIPPDLGDILKAYAKEVIRNEPEDIYSFSAKYFSQFVTSEARIQPDQLISMRQRFSTLEGDEISQKQLYELALETSGDGDGIPSSAIDKVLQLGEFGETVSWREFLVLLLSLEGASVLEAVQLLFEVFSDEGDCSLSHAEFMTLFSVFFKRDRIMRGVEGFMDKLSAHLTAVAGGKNGRIAYEDFESAEVLAEIES